MKIGILGGGMSALASAYYLAVRGHSPVVLANEDTLVDGGAAIDLNGSPVDAAPSLIDSSDTALCGLLADLGVMGQIRWLGTHSGIVTRDGAQRLDTTTDLLRFGDLRFARKLRAAAAAFYSTEMKTYARDLDRVTALDWLERVFGPTLLRDLWEPVLSARFGEHAPEVSAYWVWRLLGRLKQGRPQVRGFLRGGASGLGQRLREAVEKRGGEVQVGTNLRGIHADGGEVSVEAGDRTLCFDAVVSTLPPHRLADLGDSDLAREAAQRAVPFRSSITALAVLRRPLSDLCEGLFVGRDMPFWSLVQTTRVQPPETLGGRHLAYLTRWCGREAVEVAVPDDVVAKETIATLERCFPALGPEDIEAVSVQRVADAEPVFAVGSFERMLDPRIGGGRVYVCDASRSYPRTPGWDSDVTLAREMSARIARDL